MLHAGGAVLLLRAVPGLCGGGRHTRHFPSGEKFCCMRCEFAGLWAVRLTVLELHAVGVAQRDDRVAWPIPGALHPWPAPNAAAVMP